MYEMRQSKQNPALWLVYDEYEQWYMTGDWETCAACVDSHNRLGEEYDGDWRGYREEETDGYGY